MSKKIITGVENMKEPGDDWSGKPLLTNPSTGNGIDKFNRSLYKYEDRYKGISFIREPVLSNGVGHKNRVYNGN
jgi:hypothetical protein